MDTLQNQWNYLAAHGSVRPRKVNSEIIFVELISGATELYSVLEPENLFLHLVVSTTSK